MMNGISEKARQRREELDRRYETEGWLTSTALYAKLPPIATYKQVRNWMSVQSRGVAIFPYVYGCNRIKCIRVEQAQGLINEYWNVYKEIGEGDKLVDIHYLWELVPWMKNKKAFIKYRKKTNIKTYNVSGLGCRYSRNALDKLARELSQGVDIGEDGVPIGYVSLQSVIKQMKWDITPKGAMKRLMKFPLWKNRVKVRHIIYIPRKLADNFISGMYDEFEDKTGGDVFANYVKAGYIVERMPTFKRQAVYKMLDAGILPFPKIRFSGSKYYYYYKKAVDEYFKANP